MRVNLSEEERDELNSLKRDLFDPIKSFTAEVGSDTIGDAKRFYAAKAKKAKQSAVLAKEKAKAQAEALRQEQERMRRQRKVLVKRAMIVLALLALFSMIVISAALSSHAEADYIIALGENCLVEAEKTAEPGYTGVHEFSSIVDRTGEVSATGPKNNA